MNANGLKALNSQGGFLDQLFGYGHLGSYKLLQRGYKKMVWNDIGLENNIKVNISQESIDAVTFMFKFSF